MNLRDIRKAHGKTQKQIAKLLGISQQSYSAYENGVSQPPRNALIKLAEYYQVSTDYLLDRTSLPTSTQGQVTFPNVFPVEKRKVPFLEKITNGKLIFAEEERGFYIETLSDLRVDFCLQANDDSMINACIKDGDIVFIRSLPEVNNGEIAAVAIGDTATLKRVYYNLEKNQVTLQAENPAYPPLTYVGDELKEIRILGKAVAFQSNL